MNSQKSFILLLSLGVLFSACSSLNTSKSAKKEKAYTEDLSSYLPEEPVDSSELVHVETVEEVAIDSTLDVRNRLDTALAVVDNYNDEKTKYIEGLVIQVYAGNNRSDAKEAQMKAYRYFPDTKPHLIFDQPNYKVRLETFYTHLEAYPVFKSVQSKFPKAILIPTRIPISKEEE